MSVRRLRRLPTTNTELKEQKSTTKVLIEAIEKYI